MRVNNVRVERIVVTSMLDAFRILRMDNTRLVAWSNDRFVFMVPIGV